MQTARSSRRGGGRQCGESWVRLPRRTRLPAHGPTADAGVRFSSAVQAQQAEHQRGEQNASRRASARSASGPRRQQSFSCVFMPIAGDRQPPATSSTRRCRGRARARHEARAVDGDEQREGHREPGQQRRPRAAAPRPRLACGARARRDGQHDHRQQHRHAHELDQRRDVAGFASTCRSPRPPPAPRRGSCAPRKTPAAWSDQPEPSREHRVGTMASVESALTPITVKASRRSFCGCGGSAAASASAAEAPQIAVAPPVSRPNSAAKPMRASDDHRHADGQRHRDHHQQAPAASPAPPLRRR